MAETKNSACRICQFNNPLGTRFCGSCGNLLITPSRGSVGRRASWFERAGTTRFLGKPLGPSGIAAMIALGAFSAASLTLWLAALYRDGRLTWKNESSPQVATVVAPRVSPSGVHRKLRHPRATIVNELPAHPQLPKDVPMTNVAPAVERNVPSAPVLPVPQPQAPEQIETHAMPPPKSPPAKPAASTMFPPPSLDSGNPQQAQESPPSSPAPNTAVPLQPSPSPAEAPTPAIRQPSLGRRQGDLIWSGQLEKGMLLSIDGFKTSVGTLRGDPLPGVPVLLTLQPADVIVSQAPMSSDEYRRFVLRSPARRNTVVRVHWEILQ